MARDLSTLSTKQLLALRLCDLRLSLAPLKPAIAQLYAELKSAGLRFRPHVWISHGFFAEDSLRGFAVPFYLTHPRLLALEKKMMMEVEAGTHDWCMRILRHEAGHAIDNAVHLYRRPGYRMLFGDWAKPYPDTYRPDISSRDFVLHLDCWYAQSHPAEDFAETFAVWLNPKSDWRRTYNGWYALTKLHWVDAAMHDLAKRKIPEPSGKEHKSLSTLTLTLGEHYAIRQAAYQKQHPIIPRRDITRLFTSKPITPCPPLSSLSTRNSKLATPSSSRPLAAPIISRWKSDIRQTVNRWTGLPQLTLERTLADLITECQQRQSRLTRSESQTRQDLVALLTAHTQTFLADANHPIPL